jgi:hypothetical protein
MSREDLIRSVFKSFITDLNESVKPLTSEEIIDFTDKLIRFLRGIFNSAAFDSEFGEVFYEDDFIEDNLLKLIIIFSLKINFF